MSSPSLGVFLSSQRVTQLPTESPLLSVFLQELLALSSLICSLPLFGAVRINAGASGVSSFEALSLRIRGRKKGIEAAMIVQLTSTEAKAQTRPPR